VRKLLKFNPYFRWSALECLKSPYFASVKISKKEKWQKQKIELEIDSDEAFDYLLGSSEKYDK
jgi:hypothetical protein